MASKLVSGSISRRTSPRLNVNPRLPPVNFSNGRKAPIRRGQNSNLGHPIMNSQRNKDSDESFNGLDEMDDDEIEVNEGYNVDQDDVKKNLKLNDAMDDCLVDSLMEQNLKGQKIGGTFTKAAYRATSRAVSDKFNIFCDPTHVKNRVRTLKKHLALLRDMLKNGSGFGYNESNKMIEAEPSVWAIYIKAKPLSSQYRFTPIPNYNKLDELFGKDRATGSKAAGPKQRQLHWAKEQNNGACDSDTLEEQRDKDDDNVGIDFSHENDISSSSKVPMDYKKVDEEPKRKKTRMVDVVSEELKWLRGGMDRIAAAMEPGYTEDQLLEEIAGVGGMSDISQMTVYQSLTEDQKSARAFHKCPAEKKKIWLLVKFGSNLFDE